MVFGEKLKTERVKKGWSQEELAVKLFVSRQSVSKWENGQNYPSIEAIMKISDLFGVSIDELLRSDEELAKKVINDSKKLAYPKWKATFDVLFLLGAVLLAGKVAVFLLNRFTPLDIVLSGGSLLWNLGSLLLLIVGGAGSGALKEKYKEE